MLASFISSMFVADQSQCFTVSNSSGRNSISSALRGIRFFLMAMTISVTMTANASPTTKPNHTPSSPKSLPNTTTARMVKTRLSKVETK